MALRRRGRSLHNGPRPAKTAAIPRTFPRMHEWYAGYIPPPNSDPKAALIRRLMTVRLYWCGIRSERAR
jgi:hypothetical protein